MKRIYVILFIFFSFLLLPSFAFACKTSNTNKSEKNYCKKESNTLTKKTYCSSNYSKDKNDNGCEGKCSICRMDMKKTTKTIELHPLKGSQPKTKTITKYVCTMDGSTSDKPGKCPKCGMKMKVK